MSGGGNQKSETQTEPWEAVQPYLGEGYERIGEFLDRPTSFFPGQTYPDFSPETMAALSGMTGRAMAGSPLTGAAQQAGLGMLQDFNWQENPYMDQVTESIRSRVLPAVQSSFGMAGRSGDSPLAQGIMAREMTNALAPLQFQDYAREREMHSRNQLAAMGLAPELAGMDYTDLERLGLVGAAREAQDMRGIQEDIGRYEYGRDEEYNRLAKYMNLLGQSAPIIGGTGSATATQGGGTNPIFGLLGTAATVAPFLPWGSWFGGGGGDGGASQAASNIAGIWT